MSRKPPADNRRTCRKCHRQFRRERGSNRLDCPTCSPSRTKPLDVADPDADGDAGPGPIEAQLLADLQAAGRAETVDGLVALSVARDIDAGRVAPAQKPAVGQKLSALRDKALEGTVPAKRTRVDDLAERRAARQAS